MEIGLTLMGVGMITVFAVLLIIIFLSTQLIKLVNKIAPEEAEKPKAAAAPQAIPADIMEVIRQTVSHITGGKGNIKNVEKL